MRWSISAGSKRRKVNATDVDEIARWMTPDGAFIMRAITRQRPDMTELRRAARTLDDLECKRGLRRRPSTPSRLIDQVSAAHTRLTSDCCGSPFFFATLYLIRLDLGIYDDGDVREIRCLASDVRGFIHQQMRLARRCWR